MVTINSRNIILELTEEKDLSLHQIAKLISYDVAVISRVKNRIQKMSHRMAFKISEVFEIDLHEIIEAENIK